MKCPKCGDPKMDVTHTYRAGDAGTTQRMECKHCGCVATVAILRAIVAIEPGYGQGAAVLAKKIGTTKEFLDLIKFGVA